MRRKTFQKHRQPGISVSQKSHRKIAFEAVHFSQTQYIYRIPDIQIRRKLFHNPHIFFFQNRIQCEIKDMVNIMAENCVVLFACSSFQDIVYLSERVEYQRILPDKNFFVSRKRIR